MLAKASLQTFFSLEEVVEEFLFDSIDGFAMAANGMAEVAAGDQFMAAAKSAAII